MCQTPILPSAINMQNWHSSERIISRLCWWCRFRRVEPNLSVHDDVKALSNGIADWYQIYLRRTISYCSWLPVLQSLWLFWRCVGSLERSDMLFVALSCLCKRWIVLILQFLSNASATACGICIHEACSRSKVCFRCTGFRHGISIQVSSR